MPNPEKIGLLDTLLMRVEHLPTKKCSNCFKYKTVDQFYRRLNNYQSRCKDCNAEVCLGYQQRRKEALDGKENL